MLVVNPVFDQTAVFLLASLPLLVSDTEKEKKAKQRHSSMLLVFVWFFDDLYCFDTEFLWLLQAFLFCSGIGFWNCSSKIKTKGIV